MTDSDSQVVLKIYRKGLETRNATFETILPSWKDWDQTHHNFCRFVFVKSGSVVGWTALSQFSTRTCYSGVAEISIYVHPEHVRKGIGKERHLDHTGRCLSRKPCNAAIAFKAWVQGSRPEGASWKVRWSMAQHPDYRTPQ